MTWTTPKNWVTGEPLTATDLNEQVSDNLTFLYDFVQSYTVVRDEKTQNTHGGTFTDGAWQTRDLNTIMGNAGNNVSVASNQITLPAGSYILRAATPAFRVAWHQSRLQNITAGSTIAVGSTAWSAASDGDVTNSLLNAVFTLGTTSVLELQHQCTTERLNDGFGRAANLTTEVYTIVEIWKVA